MKGFFRESRVFLENASIFSASIFGERLYIGCNVNSLTFFTVFFIFLLKCDSVHLHVLSIFPVSWRLNLILWCGKIKFPLHAKLPASLASSAISLVTWLNLAECSIWTHVVNKDAKETKVRPGEKITNQKKSEFRKKKLNPHRNYGHSKCCPGETTS